VYFFSPIPSKFTNYNLTAGNEQPTNNTSQPKSYAAYESYRNSVLEKIPKKYHGSAVHSSSKVVSLQKENSFKDHKLDYWLDDSDMDEELPEYWRVLNVIEFA
jgi:hypothetical protein